MPDARVVICMPTDRTLPAEVVDSFAAVYGHGLVDGTVTAKIIHGDTYIDTARNLLVTYAMDVPTEPTHILWYDSDMVMPSDTVSRLVAHDKRIVGGLYHQRTGPYMPVAYRFVDEQVDTRLGAARMIEIPDGATGLERVDGLGLGCTLVELDVYREMAEHFGDPWWHQVSAGRGEDIHFFRRATDMGIETWLDLDLKCGHVTRQMIESVHYESYRRVHPRDDDPTST